MGIIRYVGLLAEKQLAALLARPSTVQKLVTANGLDKDPSFYRVGQLWLGLHFMMTGTNLPAATTSARSTS